MSPNVSVIGTGRMGSALATALFKNGFPTTVWNRTPEKTEPLARLGLRVSRRLAEAVKEAGVVIVIVSDYAVARQLVEEADVASALSGKVLVQLTTGTPQEARSMEAWARERGIGYLDGAIMSYPSGIGTADCTIFYSGPEELFGRSKPVLMALAGNSMYVGADVGHASALDVAGVNFALTTMFAFVQGHIVCTEEGLPAEAFRESVKSLLPVIEGMIAGVLSRIQQGDYRGDEATIDAWSVGPREMIAWCKDRGVPDGMARVQQELFERARKAGRDQADFAYVYELMRPARSAGAAPRDR